MHAVDAVEEVGARRVCAGDLHTLRAFLGAAQAPAVASFHRLALGRCCDDATFSVIRLSRAELCIRYVGHDCGEMRRVVAFMLRLESSDARLGHRLANTPHALQCALYKL